MNKRVWWIIAVIVAFLIGILIGMNLKETLRLAPVPRLAISGTCGDLVYWCGDQCSQNCQGQNPFPVCWANCVCGNSVSYCVQARALNCPGFPYQLCG